MSCGSDGGSAAVARQLVGLGRNAHAQGKVVPQESATKPSHGVNRRTNNGTTPMCMIPHLLSSIFPFPFSLSAFQLCSLPSLLFALLPGGPKGIVVGEAAIML